MRIPNGEPTSRRHFIATLFVAASTLAVPVRLTAREVAPAAHPEPRPDVDGSLVLAASDVSTETAELFRGIRAIPHIADGIGCHCGCGAMPDMRSLLSCYEGVGMAQYCVICSGEGRMAIDLYAKGRSLDEIREAIDRRFS